MIICLHPNPRRTRRAQIVYGTPGVLPARYRCDDCGFEWTVREPVLTGENVFG